LTRKEIRLQGSGGQGIITAGHLIGEAASLHDQKHAIMTEDYSPYVTGGWSRADVIISDEDIDYPLISSPDILVAMSQDGLDDNWRKTRDGAEIIVDEDMVIAAEVTGRKIYAVPALRIAEELGKRVVANIVMLGFLASKSGVVSYEAVQDVILKRYPKAAELNKRAFQRGHALAMSEVAE
jgi:2-oxoglutarate ferredoxin oxidoreductase subunit gamma